MFRIKVLVVGARAGKECKLVGYNQMTK